MLKEPPILYWKQPPVNSRRNMNTIVASLYSLLDKIWNVKKQRYSNDF
jgi:hypothetical protein